MPEQRLADHTTLRVGGPAESWVRCDTERQLVATVAEAQAAGRPVLVLGGGSNLVVAEDRFPGVVAEVATRGIEPDVDDCDTLSCTNAVSVKVAAGEGWDDFVDHCVGQGWWGVEALSGIPGSVGATPIQNVGAYGQEVSQTVASVRTWDRVEATQRTFAAADCGFGYRDSRFKAEPDRYVVLEVTFLLRQGSLGAPIGYAELARTLGVSVGDRAPAADVRRAVLALRRRKGMVLDAADHDTWSAGSFFTNPLLTPEQAADLPAEAPRWEQPDGRLKTSAAWLIERAGFGRGFGRHLHGGRVSLSTKHTLALTNRGGATADDVLGLARVVRDGVQAAYGVRLVNEPVLVGCTL